MVLAIMESNTAAFTNTIMAGLDDDDIS